MRIYAKVGNGVHIEDMSIEEFVDLFAKQLNGKREIVKPKQKLVINGKTIKEVIYHNPATIIKWTDGTKTIAKCDKYDSYDKEKGFYICILKELLGNKTTHALIDKYWDEWREASVDCSWK